MDVFIFSVNSISYRVELAIADSTVEGAFGRNDGDDADMADGGPVPIRVETGEGSSDADKNTDAKPGDASAKKRTHSSTKMAKKVDTSSYGFMFQSKDPKFHALPLASQRVAAFEDTVNKLVYDILISKVRQRLGEVSRLPIWSSVEEQTAFALPNFSSYPQAYVTSQLEPLAEGISTNGDSNNEDAQFFATEWMFKVAEGATALYMEQLRGIQYISDRGAQQLCIDIEYLSNVLAALSMPIPPVLATFQTCVATPRDELKDVMKSDAGSELDFPTGISFD
ncbi:hypothetical protein IGI04_039858 [Brassica rapa subsp. trilocularis]|uniref:Conserved oligomeric Golgi complex subunit 7 n=1 Tax=Brassica rapa subsp. trilocularis TaxID=1813537 RepID=A0ABQ7KL38_BRACM|nr:hypothetical protein IGI04_039858 [Brassica rapa subsp. trilocularis]